MARSLFCYDIMFEYGNHIKVVARTIDDILDKLIDYNYDIDSIQNIIRLDLYYNDDDYENLIKCY
jgi:hypothetical protein